MSIQSAKRKLSLDERAAALKAKNESRKLPPRLATPELRRKRLLAIQKRMDLTHAEFQTMLGLAEQHWRSVREGKKPVAVGFVLLAEIELKRFLQREYRHNIQTVPEIPEEYANNTELMSKIVTEHLMGSDNEKIAAQFGVRPEIVEYYISRLS